MKGTMKGLNSATGTRRRSPMSAGGGRRGRWRLALVMLAGLLAGARVDSGLVRAAAPAKALIVYCAQDQVYAEPIFDDFTRETGISIRAVFDSEAVKTVGLVNRLVREQRRPRCDVYWGNEEFNARRLVDGGILEGGDRLVRWGRRSRVWVVSGGGHEGRPGVPSTLLALTNAAWRGRVSMAYPLFGTTCTHVLALRQVWGVEVWRAWCRGLASNRVFIEEGNSQVVRRVARGEAWIGLTDSDDVAAGRQQGFGVTSAGLGSEGLLIPNVAGVVKGRGGDRDAVDRLVGYLQSTEVVRRLVAAGALDAGVGVGEASGLKPDWGAMIADYDRGVAELRELFRR